MAFIEGFDSNFCNTKIINFKSIIILPTLELNPKSDSRRLKSYNNSLGSVTTPVTAAAAATNGLANNVREPGP